jgi:mono/diheme cytochrome c family protein
VALLALGGGLEPTAAFGPVSTQGALEPPSVAQDSIEQDVDRDLLDCGRGPDAWEPGTLAVDEGATLYQQNCSSCHGVDGGGWPPSHPPLAGHAPRLLAAPGGRSYLLRVPLFGLTGDIEVKGRRYAGVMSGFDFRKDEELAEILNYVLTAWGNDRLLPAGHRPVTAAEVATERKRDLSAEEVRSSRPSLASAH